MRAALRRGQLWDVLAVSWPRPGSLGASKGNFAVRFFHRNVRTSQGTFISRHEDQDGVLAWVEDKIALLSAIPAGHGEVCLPDNPLSTSPISLLATTAPFKGVS